MKFKKLIYWFIIIIFISNVFAINTRVNPSRSDFSFADINNDGKINVVDAQCVILAAHDISKSCLKKSADLNCDGEVNVVDVQIVIQLSLGKQLNVEIDQNQDGIIDSCQIEYCNFVDPIFEEVVREAANLESGVPIKKSDVDGILKLKANSKGITDVKGIECLTSLEELELMNNKIKKFNVPSELSGLDYIILAFNKITKLTFSSDMLELKSLILDGNNISEITLLNTPNLEKLALNKVNISELILPTEMKKLKHLFLSNNQLNKVILPSKMPELLNLNLGYNNLYETNLPKMPKLKYLDLNNNQLTEVNLSYGLSKLISLRLDNNNLTELNLSSYLPKLKYLDLDNNKLTKLSLNDLPILSMVSLMHIPQLNTINFENVDESKIYVEGFTPNNLCDDLQLLKSDGHLILKNPKNDGSIMEEYCS